MYNNKLLEIQSDCEIFSFATDLDTFIGWPIIGCPIILGMKHTQDFAKHYTSRTSSTKRQISINISICPNYLKKLPIWRLSESILGEGESIGIIASYHRHSHTRLAMCPAD